MVAQINKEVEDHYNKLFDLFQQEGWKIVIEDMKEAMEMRKESVAIDPLTDIELREKRGELKVLNALVHYQNTIEYAWETLQEEAQMANEDADI